MDAGAVEEPHVPQVHDQTPIPWCHRSERGLADEVDRGEVDVARHAEDGEGLLVVDPNTRHALVPASRVIVTVVPSGPASMTAWVRPRISVSPRLPSVVAPGSRHRPLSLTTATTASASRRTST